jgi:hypothetical protein
MSLIFEIEPKPSFKSKKVFGIEIPLYGELTVNETIAVDKAIAVDLSSDSANTEWKIVQVSAWLAVRLSAKREEITAQLYKSMPLIEALWTVFALEREGITESYELDEPVTEGKDGDTVPSLTSSPSGMESTLNFAILDSPISSETLETPEFL